MTTGPGRSLRLALLHLLLAGTVLTAVMVLVRVDSGPVPVADVVYLLVGLWCMAVGALCWDRRPSNGTGALLSALGLSVLVASLLLFRPAPLEFAGQVAAEVPIAVLLHLTLAFPGGRLHGRVARVLAAAGYALTALPPLVTLTLAGRPPGAGPGPGSVLAHRADQVQGFTGTVVITLAAVVMVRRVLRARKDRGERRVLVAVAAYGIGAVVFMPLSAQVIAPALGLSDQTRFTLQIVALAGFPVAMAAAMFVGAFARTGEVQELATWLAGRDTDRPPLRDALAQVLGDPSLELLFHHSGDGTLLDPYGRRTPHPQDRPPHDRGVVEIEGRDGPLAVVVHDPELVGDRSVVEAAGRMVALALERERLTAELLAGREVIRQSRLRLVEVGDQERRRLAQDLHDLLQSRLVLSAVHAAQLEATVTPGLARDSATALRSGLDEAVTELRRQLQGVMPASLIERGLLVALEDLADRVPLRTELDLPDGPLPLPPAVASTSYFVTAEAVANAVRHARATRIRIAVRPDGGDLRIEVTDDGSGGAHTPGNGLRGMVARVEALDGRLLVQSPVGVGTTVVAWLPCAW